MKRYCLKISVKLLVIFICLILGSGIIYSQDVQTFYKNGYEYFNQGNYEKAEQNYKKAIEIDPNFENAHYWLGKVYKQTGDYSKAIQQWKEVLRINSQNQYAFENLVNSFNSTSLVRSDKANDYLDEGLKMIGNPEEYLLKENAPSVDMLLSAVPYFKKAINIENNLLQAYFWIGEIYQILGEKSTRQFLSLAIEYYKKTINAEEVKNPISFMHPSSYWRSYIQLAKVYRSLKLKESEEKLWTELEKVKALPYQQALNKKGYFGFGYPSRIEVSFEKEEKIENWIYLDKNITFIVINGEVKSEKVDAIEEGKVETKIEESVPEEKPQP